MGSFANSRKGAPAKGDAARSGDRETFISWPYGPAERGGSATAVASNPMPASVVFTLISSFARGAVTSHQARLPLDSSFPLSYLNRQRFAVGGRSGGVLLDGWRSAELCNTFGVQPDGRSLSRRYTADSVEGRPTAT